MMTTVLVSPSVMTTICSSDAAPSLTFSTWPPGLSAIGCPNEAAPTSVSLSCTVTSSAPGPRSSVSFGTFARSASTAGFECRTISLRSAPAASAIASS